MSAIANKKLLIQSVSQESKELLHGRGNLPREDLEYVVSKLPGLKDSRLKECITELIGWGDDERARLETQVAIGIECMKECTPSKLREAARRVEMRYYMKPVTEEACAETRLISGLSSQA